MKLTISIKTIRMALAGLAVLSMSACEGLLPDNKVDLDLTDKNASLISSNNRYLSAYSCWCLGRNQKL